MAGNGSQFDFPNKGVFRTDSSASFNKLTERVDKPSSVLRMCSGF